MPQIKVEEGRHLTADEYVSGVLVRRGQLYFAGETIPAVSAAEYQALVVDPKTRDAKRFTDKGKS